MIFPDKNISLQYSILGVGSRILEELSTPQTISSLWERVRKCKEINTYDKLVLGLDFLYIIGLIELSQGVIRKVKR
jgi:hypothetical protein